MSEKIPNIFSHLKHLLKCRFSSVVELFVRGAFKALAIRHSVAVWAPTTCQKCSRYRGTVENKTKKTLPTWGGQVTKYTGCLIVMSVVGAVEVGGRSVWGDSEVLNGVIQEGLPENVPFGQVQSLRCV